MRRLLLLLLLLASPLAWSVEPPCTVRTVVGDWSFTATGYRISSGASLPAPIAAVGVFTLGADSKVTSGIQRTSLGGQQLTETFTGSFTMTTECRGFATITIVSSNTAFNRTVNLYLIVANRDRVRMLFIDAGTISTVDATRLGR